MMNPIKNKELQRHAFNNPILHAYLRLHQQHPTKEYTDILEAALVTFINQNKEFLANIIDMKQKTILGSDEPLSMNREGLLRSMQIQVRETEQRYADLMEKHVAQSVTNERLDHENQILEHALTKLKVDVEPLIGRPARTYDGDVIKGD